MAKAFMMCHSEKFRTDDFLIPMQQDLLEVEGEAEISIKPHRENIHLSFDQYICNHDFLHNTKGKVFNQYFNYYFEPINFYTYYNKENKLTIIQTKTDAALDFISKLNETKHYEISPVKINFKSIIPYITEITGAWIADLKRTHLKTAGFFGPHVNKSEEYIEAAAEGNVSSILMKYIGKKTLEEYTVTISKKGSIVLYDTFSTIEEEIDIAIEVYEEFIKPHL